MEKTFAINLDGHEHTITADPAMPHLYALINELGEIIDFVLGLSSNNDKAKPA